MVLSTHTPTQSHTPHRWWVTGLWEWLLLDAAITIAKCRVLVSPCRTLTHDTALVAEYLK